jgi:prepilin-type N-terminal cleavage/methylation domain-containing protein
MRQQRGSTNRTKLKLIGFTLAEILVALALIALLAAVLLPTVAGQILKGDASRVAEDLNAVRSGIEQFLADVHRYPGKYSQLSTTIKTGTHADINGATIATGLASKWNGPYVSKDTTNSTVPTGFGGTITNTFSKTANTNGVDYVTVSITGIDSLDFLRLDTQVDGTANPVAGLLRWVTGTTRYLAIPIQ